MVRIEPRAAPALKAAVHSCGAKTIHHRPSTYSARTSWRLYWFPKGGGFAEWGGSIYRATQDRVLVIPPYTSVRQGLQRPSMHYWLHVNYGHPFDSVMGTVRHVSITPWFRATIKRIQELERDSRAKMFLATSLATWIAAHLPETIWPAAPTDARIRRALQRMQGDPGDKTITNDALAEEARMSRDAFIRLFRRQVGMPPNAHLIRLRLERACALLLNTDQSIDRIADICGFGVRSYMSRLFRQRLSTSPAAYRKGEEGVSPGSEPR